MKILDLSTYPQRRGERSTLMLELYYYALLQTSAGRHLSCLPLLHACPPRFPILPPADKGTSFANYPELSYGTKYSELTGTMNKCLVVDDDQHMLEVLAQCVQDLGYEPIKAEDGDQAWSAYLEHQPALVISDIHMPNRNGLLLLKDIKDNEPTTPVILITGWVHYKAALNMAPPRPEAFLEKPFSLDQLRQAIEGLQLRQSA